MLPEPSPSRVKLYLWVVKVHLNFPNTTPRYFPIPTSTSGHIAARSWASGVCFEYRNASMHEPVHRQLPAPSITSPAAPGLYRCIRLHVSMVQFKNVIYSQAVTSCKQFCRKSSAVNVVNGAEQIDAPHRTQQYWNVWFQINFRICAPKCKITFAQGNFFIYSKWSHCRALPVRLCNNQCKEEPINHRNKVMRFAFLWRGGGGSLSSPDTKRGRIKQELH